MISMLEFDCLQIKFRNRRSIEDNNEILCYIHYTIPFIEILIHQTTYTLRMKHRIDFKNRISYIKMRLIAFCETGFKENQLISF